MANATRPEPITDAVHLSIDMQNIFAPGGIWQTPWMERVLPVIVDITARHAARTVFTRFITPVRAERAARPLAALLPTNGTAQHAPDCHRLNSNSCPRSTGLCRPRK